MSGSYFTELKTSLAVSAKELDTWEKNTCATDKGTKKALMRVL